MSHDFFADGQGQGQKSYKPSSHPFTDPIRLFKANDPYYWEVDNIPLQELQSNILWLKDQVGLTGALSGGGTSRADLDELRPDATGDTRNVQVLPGRFMGRVNDAYNKGIASIVKKAVGSIDSNLTTEITITTPEDVIKKLAGVTITSYLANNGLYDVLQHHVTAPNLLNNIDWNSVHTQFAQNNKVGVFDLPKIKLALWKQGTTVTNIGNDYNSHVDLQQLAVEFTRVYGAPFRTALVNVPNTLSIEVPSFDSTDYQNDSIYVPSVRVDLLFLYTKPIDDATTAILKPNGSVLTTITSPQLGIVKGAGVIALGGRGAFAGQDIDTSFFESSTWTSSENDPTSFFNASGAFDLNMNPQISSPIGDQNQTQMGLSNYFSNFPSPDDLLNLAPYITDGISKSSLQLVGQSVLPIAYIFVRKGEPLITRNDILDIRPFFRTAELTYNERAGVAGASPPLSLANPAVGKEELRDTATKLRNHVIASIPSIPNNPRPVGSGFVFGGIKYGPEGVMARLASDSNDPTSKLTAYDQTSITDYLKASGPLPPSMFGNVPSFPDWEIADWATNTADGGQQQNDRFFYFYQDERNNNYPLAADASWDSLYGGRVSQTVTYNKKEYNDGRTGTMCMLVKKRIYLDKVNVPWMADYNVNVSFANCAVSVSTDKYGNYSDTDHQIDREEDGAWWTQPQGLYVDKYPDFFDIICMWRHTEPFRGSHCDLSYVAAASPPSAYRTSHIFSKVFVTHATGFEPQKYSVATRDFVRKLGGYGTVHNMFKGAWCTYPTVKFEVMGYPENYTGDMLTNAGINNTVTLS
jgi:hypothetical protein